MKTITHNRHTLKIWTSMDEMPIERYQAFNLFILMESGIGSDLDGMLSHLRQIDTLVAKDKKAEARAMLANMRQSIIFIMNNVSPEMSAFAAITATIDGRPVEDLTEEGVKAFTQELSQSGWTMAKIKAIVKEVKANIIQEFAIYFSSRAATLESKESHAALKKRAILSLDDIIKGTDSSKELSKIEDFLLSMFKPKIFWGPDGAEVKFVKSFDSVSALVNQSVSTPVKEMTARQFYSTLALIEEQAAKSNAKK